MSEDKSETDQDPLRISDEQLPDDVRPGPENPLASEPDESDASDDSDEDPSEQAATDGMPDMGEPGAP